jgi:hypothetical protein
LIILKVKTSNSINDYCHGFASSELVSASGEYFVSDVTPLRTKMSDRYFGAQIEEYSLTKAIEKFTKTFERIGRQPNIKSRVMCIERFEEFINPCSVIVTNI